MTFLCYVNYTAFIYFVVFIFLLTFLYFLFVFVSVLNFINFYLVLIPSYEGILFDFIVTFSFTSLRKFDHTSKQFYRRYPTFTSSTSTNSSDSDHHKVLSVHVCVRLCVLAENKRFNFNGLKPIKFQVN